MRTNARCRIMHIGLFTKVIHKIGHLPKKCVESLHLQTAV